MAAHTFELSPNWMRARPALDVARPGDDAEERIAVIELPTPRPRFAFYWLVIPIIAAVAGLAVYLSPSPDSAAPRRSAAMPVTLASAVPTQAQVGALPGDLFRR
jgi:hypothetical protein